MNLIARYTRMLRRSDEISYACLLLGMRLYRPDPAKVLR